MKKFLSLISCVMFLTGCVSELGKSGVKCGDLDLTDAFAVAEFAMDSFKNKDWESMDCIDFLHYVYRNDEANYRGGNLYGVLFVRLEDELKEDLIEMEVELSDGRITETDDGVYFKYLKDSEYDGWYSIWLVHVNGEFFLRQMNVGMYSEVYDSLPIYNPKDSTQKLKNYVGDEEGGKKLYDSLDCDEDFDAADPFKVAQRFLDEVMEHDVRGGFCFSEGYLLQTLSTLNFQFDYYEKHFKELQQNLNNYTIDEARIDDNGLWHFKYDEDSKSGEVTTFVIFDGYFGPEYYVYDFHYQMPKEEFEKLPVYRP